MLLCRMVLLLLLPMLPVPRLVLVDLVKMLISSNFYRNRVYKKNETL